MNSPRIDFGNKYIQEMSVAFICALGLFLIGFPSLIATKVIIIGVQDQHGRY